ncbi:molybdopterin cofactor-binding domain-containing protein [Bacterioplanoides sp. SCSIO 12839]|uniref:xanthine dehydrogenase family protein molybdopterin-binding subunit n=1 Tax=Bacterioplanoides sp. SCSIO 12839 TaxID=2829569 RepID=UPI002105FCC8|nr:molybdopterin cofactor-binding domain-containing protein [Bacterioplanoides sp. SCSIO 12839]UTW48860.1 xanthine dehydrogenase family protein molybdopterin-binding subunit [Bacterioplanoides sp. SCSIO 12839]
MPHTSLSRRQFLKISVLYSGGLLASCSSAMPLSASTSSDDTPDVTHTWLHIDEHGVITYQVPSVEMGQGVETGLTMIVAEELDADWSQVRTEFATNHPAFNNPMLYAQMTAASRSVWAFWEPMRVLGAGVRQMLVEAAAAKWQVSVDSCRTEQGWVIHSSGKKLSYGELAQYAAHLTPPRNPTLKQPQDFKLIGQSIPRVDIPLKTAGDAVYGVDVNIPDARTASIRLCPTLEGDLASYNADKALALPGVEEVIAIPKDLTNQFQPAGIAVVADSYFTAQKALALIDIEWYDGQYAKLSSDSIRSSMVDTLNEMEKGDTRPFQKKLEVEYETPFLTHAPLEPMNATARVSDTHCEIWAPTQNTSGAEKCATILTGLDAENITVHTPYLGGAFGRRLEIDYVVYAVYVAQQSKVPVKLIWSREEDMKHGYYRPASVARFQVGLNDQGYPQLWHSQITAPHYFGRFQSLTMPATRHFPIDKMTKGAVASGMTDSLIATGPFPYAVDDFDMSVELAELPVPTGNHRAVMHSYTGFYAESVVDEAAHLAGIDPYQYRRQLLLNTLEQSNWVANKKGLDHRRLLTVLDRAAEEAGWGKQASNHHQGIAVSFSNKSFVAQVVELSIDEQKKVIIHKVTAVVDCGVAVNPDSIRAQFEGGIFWALCGTFMEELTFRNGQVEQNNFYDYQTLYTRHMPQVDVHIIASAEPPSGVGEPAIPALIPALTNAIYAATGERIRRLPIKHYGYSNGA